MYALVEYSGKQFILREGEEIKIPLLDQKAGTKISFDNILLFNDGKSEQVGAPYVKSIACQAKVLSHGKEKKVIVFKKKRRKGYHKKNGHRQQYTLVKVEKFSKGKVSASKAKTKPTTKKSDQKVTKKADTKVVKKAIKKTVKKVVKKETNK